jgi:hypothetical protein
MKLPLYGCQAFARVHRTVVAFPAAMATVLLVALSAGASSEDGALFSSGTEALAEGRPGDAIADFEALADRGVVDPAASFDRGLAYANRVRIGAEQPGDLGRAALGFSEARDLASDPALVRDATRALATIRAEVARRRVRGGEPALLDEGKPLGRTLVELLPENTWAVLAAVASIALGVGLFARGTASDRRRRVGATLVCAIAAPVLVASAALALAARSERLHLVEGIIVTPVARPADEKGIAIPGATSIPEAALVTIAGDRPGWVHVRSGNLIAWIPSQTVRPIARQE